MRRRAVIAVFLAACAPACIPYTVGSTAMPVPEGQRSTSLVMSAMPPVDLDSTHSVSRLSVDGETRFGLDARSDLGVRLIGISGVVFNYKRLLSDTIGARVAIMPGAGIVNAAQHGYFEFTLLISGRESPTYPRTLVAPGQGASNTGPKVVPYGGLRVMHVVPIAEGAVHDQPTVGAFIGMRLGTKELGISPELGVFRDHSALGVRRRDIVFIPAITLHGEELLRFVRTIPVR